MAHAMHPLSVTARLVALTLSTTAVLLPMTAAHAVTAVGPQGSTSGTRVCGTATGVDLTHAVHVPSPVALTPRTKVDGFIVVDNVLYVKDAGSGRLNSYDMSGTALATYPVPPGPFTVDPSGASYVAEAPDKLAKRSGDGTIVWTVTLPAPIQALAGVPGAPWRLVAKMSDRTQLVDPGSGVLGGPAALQGAQFAADTGDGVLSVDDHYVRVYGSSLQERQRIGSAADANAPLPDGAALHFHLPGGAARLADGRMLVTDSSRGIWLLDRLGVPVGLASESALGSVPQGASLVVVRDSVLFTSGAPYSWNQTVAKMPLADLLRLAGGQPSSAGPRLGFGAGLSTGVAGNYFPAGSTPTIGLAFDDEWDDVPGLTLRYSVRDAQQVADGDISTATDVALTAAAMHGGAQLTLPAARPGAYEIDAHLFKDGQEESATCVHYTVGAPGMTLDLARLPGSADAGGPDGPRGVALADLFGSGGHRMGLDWRKLLDANGRTTFLNYDAEVQAAAALAQSKHVDLSLQLGSGGPERAFVDNGTWGARVKEVVAHFAPYVHYWEAWNEPNITGFSATDYTNKILKPVSLAVHAADPEGKVIGGSVVGLGDYPYWQSMVDAGALSYMDIAAIHPYTGHNRSFEEEGFSDKLQQIKAILAKGGKPDMPVWMTEFAFWSNGPSNWFSQADKSVRAKIVAQSLGVDHWDYFLSQGTWGNDGVTFSLIEGNHVVKPAAVAMMQSRSEMSGRHFSGWVATGVPHAYVARFGPREGGTDEVLAMWSDDAEVPVAVTSAGASNVEVADEYGASRSVTLAAGAARGLRLTGSVQYVSGPLGTLSIGALETWGSNLALARSGSMVSASSAGNWNLADKAIDGVGSALAQGDFRSSSAWASAPGDERPTLTVTFPAVKTLDRVVLATGGLGSVQPGIRDFDVDLQHEDGSWTSAAQVRGAFARRVLLSSFPATPATALRVTVLSVNLGGYNGGAAPWFWPTDAASLSDPTQSWYGPAIVRELEAYGPGDITPSTPLLSDQSAPASTPATTSPPSPSPAATTEPVPTATPVPSEPSTAQSPPPSTSPDNPPSSPAPSSSPSPSPTAPPGNPTSPHPTPAGNERLATEVRASGTSAVTAGTTVIRTARLTTAPGNSHSGMSLQLWTRPHGSQAAWVAERTATTDQAGVARFPLVRTRNTDLRVVFSGTLRLRPSASAIFTLYTRRNVTAASSRTTVPRGSLVRLSGHVSPTTGGWVYVQRFDSGRWRAVAQAVLLHGTYRATLRVDRPGAVFLRVVRLADATTALSFSHVLGLRVR